MGEYKITITLNKAFRVFVPFLFSILAFGASVPVAFASDTGAQNPTTVTTIVSNVTGGGIGWTNTSSALVIDGTSAGTQSLPATKISKYLKLSGFNFSIPSEATIVGIKVSVVRRGTSSLIKDNSIILIGGSGNSEDKVSSDAWPTKLTSVIYGGATDTWNIAWTSAQINNSAFGLEISVQNTDSNSGHDAYIDGATIVVYYTVPAAKAITVTAENFNTNKGADYYGPTVGYTLGGTDADQVASVSVALFDGSNNLLITNTSKSAAKVNNTSQGPQYSSAFIIIPGTYSTSSTWNFGDISALSANVIPAKAVITVTDLNGFIYTAENDSLSEATATWGSLFAKTVAKADVETALGTYTEDNYTAGNWTTLNAFHTNGDVAIDDATTLVDVTSARDTATAGMANVTKLEVNQIKTKTDSNGNGLATIDATTPEVIIASSTQPVIITVETPNATFDLTGLVDLERGTGVLPQMTITAGSARVEIPDGTTVTAPGWDGILSAPTSGTTAGTAPAGFSVGDTVIEMGSAFQTLTFDQAVKITLTGVIGTVGYRPAGSTAWQTIDTQCTSATNHDNISAPGECYFPDGGNTIIWTYHFTSFGEMNPIVYGCMDSTATNYNSTATSQTGVTCTYPTVNGSILAFSGSGSPNPLPSATAAMPVVPATPATVRGQELGATTYNFTRNLGFGLSGSDVTELQKVLIAAGILKIDAPTGNFGQLTKVAVQVFQKSHGISQTGFVGPLTRGELNKGTNLTTAQADAILSFLESFGVDALVVANVKASFGR